MGTVTKRKTTEVKDETGKVIRRGRTRYRAEVFLKGHPRVSKTFWEQKKAETWIRDTEDAMRGGTYLQLLDAQKYTVKKMIDRYIIEVLPDKRSSGTVKGQLLWWRQNFGLLTLSSFTPKQVLEGRDQLSKLDRKPATTNRYLAALSACCTHALKHWQWLSDNPVRKVPKLKEPSGRTRYLDDDERKRLLNVCPLISPELQLAVVLALSTGARRNNIWTLSWKDVDLTKDKELVIFRETKNGTEVRVPLAGIIIGLLIKHRKVRRLDTDLLFPSLKNPQQAYDFRAPFAKALKHAQIENFRWHDLRHSAASYLAQQGVDLRMIAAILGQKTLQMAMRYSHLNVESMRPAIERMTDNL